MPPALYALAVATFAIGTTEFVIVGLVPEIATDLGVSIPTAGLLVSLYALSITLGTPIFSALTGALPRRGLAIGLMALFTICKRDFPRTSTLAVWRFLMDCPSIGRYRAVQAVAALWKLKGSRSVISASSAR
ncbi:MFS family permease [Bradyrhizobium sp. USDA 4501]